jgi:hypothetical protein
MKFPLWMLAGLAAGSAHAQIQLFAPEAIPAGFPLRQGAVSAIGVRPDFDKLSVLAVGDEVQVPLGDGFSVTARVSRVVRLAQSRVTIHAEVLDLPEASFILCQEDDAIAMSVWLPTIGGLYRLQYIENGLHAACKLDDRLLPECGGTPQAPPPPDLDIDDPAGDDDHWTVGTGRIDGRPDLGDGSAGGIESAGCTPSTPIIDTMVVYTDVARSAAGGASAIRAECRLAIESTNAAYARSGISVRQRLVWAGEVTYNEAGSFEDHLNRVTDAADGFFDWINVTKDQVNADLCAMFVDDTSSGGLGWCAISSNARAYSITRWDIAASQFVHAHETGHNLGCAHDPDNVDCNPASSYGLGHRFFGNDSVQYRTVMSYAPGTRIQNFSNPNVNFQGQPTGLSTRNNARIINERDTIIEDLQFTRWDIYVNLAYSGTEIGTYALPYNTVSEGIGALAVGTNAGELPSLYIRAGTSSYVGTISKAMEINACSGVVNIGGNP